VDVVQQLVAVSMVHRLIPDLPGMDSRHAYHLASPLRYGHSVLISRERRARRASASLATQDQSGERCLLDHTHPSLPQSMHIERPQQEQEYPPQRVIQRPTCSIYVVTTVAEETKESRDQQPEPTPYLTGEKVRGQQYIHMKTDELSPGRGLLTLRGGEQPLAF
jgi:hypothetical protein